MAHAKTTYVKQSNPELRKALSKLQYKVTQQEGTEPAFNNAYWDNTQAGIYVDIVSGEPLFSSLDKYKSGTGWPSFTKPINPNNLIKKRDWKLLSPRTELRSKKADSHIGHVFKDGPAPMGLRYCVNSAAMKFIPVSKLKQQGYEEYLALFVSTVSSITLQNGESLAIFAGGCFWCMQSPFDKTPGVQRTIMGYTGGLLKNPTYPQVTSGTTGHVEAIAVVYDPKRVTYSELLVIFWKNVDPTDAGGQFCDRGNTYVSAIFYTNEKQKQQAEASKQSLLENKTYPNIETSIRSAQTFYPAEKYHQDYYKKNPIRYKYYRYACGRDKRLKALLKR